jgi:hypothetical protein
VKIKLGKGGKPLMVGGKVVTNCDCCGGGGTCERCKISSVRLQAHITSSYSDTSIGCSGSNDCHYDQSWLASTDFATDGLCAGTQIVCLEKKQNTEGCTTSPEIGNNDATGSVNIYADPLFNFDIGLTFIANSQVGTPPNTSSCGANGSLYPEGYQIAWPGASPCGIYHFSNSDNGTGGTQSWSYTVDATLTIS